MTYFNQNIENELGSNEDLDSQLFEMVQDLDLSKPPSFPYTDNNFSNNDESILGKNYDKNDPFLKKIKTWKRLTDISSKAKLFLDGAEPSDVLQGGNKDCYLLGALSVVATKPKILDHLFMEQEIGQTMFTLRFFKDGRWKHITIDNYLPVSPENKLVFGKCKDPNEFWVPLAEKAYAKIHGSYKAIEVGWTHEALVDLTGGCAYRIEVSPKDGKNDKLWNIIMDCNKEEYLMGTMMNKQEIISGLLPKHAYALLKAVIINNTKLIQLRNPWGKTEWIGDWSDYSSKWKAVSSAEKQRVGFTIEDDGTFFISYQDFCKFFTSLEICKLFFKEKNLRQSFEGKFDKNVNMHYRNPKDCYQYLLNLEKKSSVCISLLQSDKRLESNKSDDKVCFGIRLYKNINGNIEDGSNKYIAQVPKFSWEREVILEIELEEGSYTIIPSLYQKGLGSKFFLRLFSESLFSLSQLNPKPDENDEIYQYHLENNDNIKDEFIDRKKQKQIDPNFRSQRSLLIQKLSKSKMKQNTNIYFSNNYKTATHTSKVDTPATFFSQDVYSKGEFYFTVKIVNTTNPSNIMIGILDGSLHKDNSIFLSHGPRGWGYYAYDGSAYYKFNSKSYGPKFGIGDVVGCLVNLKKGELSFYLNDNFLGTAYTGIQGPVSPSFTLYSYGDEITIDYESKPPDQSILKLFNEGDLIYIKSKNEKYISLDFEGKDSSENRLLHDCLFKVEYENQYVKFKNLYGIELQLNGNKYFLLTKLNGGYGLILKDNHWFLGISHDGNISSYPNSSPQCTKWTFLPLTENPIYSILKEKSYIILKSYYHTFISCSKDGMIYLSENPKDESLLEVEREGQYFKFKTIYGNYLSISPKKYLFFVTEHAFGYSIQSELNFLGISSKDKIENYDGHIDPKTRFYFEDVVSSKLLLNDSIISIKTFLGKYLAFNEKGEIFLTTEKYKFKVIREGKKFKFESKDHKMNLITTINSDLFNVYKMKNDYLLFSGQHYLGTNDQHILLYSKDNGKETRFIFEF